MGFICCVGAFGMVYYPEGIFKVILHNPWTIHDTLSLRASSIVTWPGCIRFYGFVVFMLDCWDLRLLAFVIK